MSERGRALRWDASVAAVLALAVACGVAVLTRRLVPTLADEATWDVWFGADCPRVVHDYLHRTLHRASLHPFHALLTFPPVFVLRHVLGDMTAVRLLLVAIAAKWIALLYAFVRLAGCRRRDAVLIALMGMVSAAALFWLPVPETHPLGSVTLLAVLCAVALAERRPLPLPAWAGVVIASMSVNVTNLLPALTAVVFERPWRRAAAALGLAALVAGGLWMVQRAVFIPEHTTYSMKQEGYFVHGPKDPIEAYRRTKTMLCQPIMMSDLWSGERFWIENRGSRAAWPNALATSMWYRDGTAEDPGHPVLVGAGTVWGGIGVAAWFALLVLGVVGLVLERGRTRLRLVVGVGLAGQLVFHLYYGALNAFLFSINMLPLLIAVVAFAMRGRARPLALALAAVVTLTAGVNNGVQLVRALDWLEHNGAPKGPVFHLGKQAGSGASSTRAEPRLPHGAARNP